MARHSELAVKVSCDGDTNLRKMLILCCYFSGDKMVDEGAQETSTVVVETVQKVAKGGKNTGVVMPAFKSDASLVTSKGMGLKKAFMGKTNTFTISATEAGK